MRAEGVAGFLDQDGQPVARLTTWELPTGRNVSADTPSERWQLTADMEVLDADGAGRPGADVRLTVGRRYWVLRSLVERAEPEHRRVMAQGTGRPEIIAIAMWEASHGGPILELPDWDEFAALQPTGEYDFSAPILDPTPADDPVWTDALPKNPFDSGGKYRGGGV